MRQEANGCETGFEGGERTRGKGRETGLVEGEGEKREGSGRKTGVEWGLNKG